MSVSNISSARAAIRQALPEGTSAHGQAPDLRYMHVPSSHAKALHPDTLLVLGMRGAGKSFWWAALQEPQHRALLEQVSPRSEISPKTQIAVGFGESPRPDEYPGRDTLTELLNAGKDARDIWRTVIVRKLASADDPIRKASTWPQRIEAVIRDPEYVEHLLYEADCQFAAEGKWWVAVFDALDRSANNWQSMHALVRGLLQTALDLRAYRRLRVKCFLRVDQLVETQVADFPDASKVLASKVELGWPPEELYELLWQYLGNAPENGAEIRGEVDRLFHCGWREIALDGMPVWQLGRAAQRGEELHRPLFHAVTGPWMGKGARRGFPYTWTVNHLADAHGRVSPRSFLVALRKAAEDSETRYSNHEFALHYESIKRGVQAASQVRVNELKEDYPWVHELMAPLQGLVVPCDFKDIASRWNASKILERLKSDVAKGEVRLPPAHLSEGAEGVRRDLEQLAIFTRLRDGRVNVPDVFRVGYGIGRRGGVRPIKKGEPA